MRAPGSWKCIAQTSMSDTRMNASHASALDGRVSAQQARVNVCETGLPRQLPECALPRGRLKKHYSQFLVKKTPLADGLQDMVQEHCAADSGRCSNLQACRG